MRCAVHGLLVFASCLLAGAPAPASSGAMGPGGFMPVVPSAPPLAAHLTVAHPPSPLGWASFDLAAAPEVDEIEVRVTVGAPVAASRWTDCSVLRLRAGERVAHIALRHLEVSMEEGVYEAVTGKLSIEHLRPFADAPALVGEVCGDRFVLAPADARALADFVRDFDDRALYDGPPPPPPPPLLGPDGEWTEGEPPPEHVPA